MLIVRAGGVRLYRCRRGRIGPPLEFGAGREGLAAFGQTVREDAGSPIRLLVDLVEEDFHWDTVPHVAVRSRRSMLAARGARRFGATPYVYSELAGRLPEGRRDDRVRYSAIVAPDRLDPWLEVLRDHEARLAGVHSLPIVSTGLLRFFPDASGRVLLVTASGAGGLRQSYFDDGALVTSRLASLPPGSLPERAGAIAGEIERFRRHIERSGLPVEALSIRIVVTPRLAPIIRNTGAGRDTRDEVVVEVRTLEERVAGRQRRPALSRRDKEPEDEDADRLLVRLVLRHPPPNHYAPPVALSIHRTRRAVRALCGMGLAAFVAGSASGGIFWHRATERAAAIDDMVRAAADYGESSRDYEMPSAAVGVKDLDLAIELASRIEAARTGPLAVLDPVSRALEGFPDLRLESVEWSERREARPEGRRAGLMEPAARLRTATLRGWFEPFGGHFQAAADEVHRFSEVLASQPRLTDVDVLEAPGERGGVGRGGAGRIRFAVALEVDVRAR